MAQTKRGAKRKVHDDDGPPRNALAGADEDNHQFALLSFRVSERAKLEITERRKADGMTESVYLRRVIYQHLGLPITDSPKDDV